MNQLHPPLVFGPPASQPGFAVVLTGFSPQTRPLNKRTTTRFPIASSGRRPGLGRHSPTENPPAGRDRVRETAVLEVTKTLRLIAARTPGFKSAFLDIDIGRPLDDLQHRGQHSASPALGIAVHSSLR